MADYYVLYEGTQYEVADAAAGVAKAKELGPSAVLYFSDNCFMDYVWYNDNVSAVIQNGAYVRFIYPGTNSESVNVDDLTVTLDGGTINGIYGGAGANAGAGTIGNVTINILGGSDDSPSRVNNTTGIVGTGYTDQVTQGDVVINFDGYVKPDGVNQVHYAMAKSAPKSVTINMIDGYNFRLCGGTNITNANITTTSTTINMTGGVVDQIYGSSPIVAKLTADVHINVSGGLVSTGFYGAAGAAKAQLVGNAYINISGGLFTTGTAFYAGGYQGAHTGDVITTISGGTIIGRIYNGSIKNTDSAGAAIAREGNLTLNYTGGEITQFIFGGNNTGDINGNVTVNLEGVTYNGANSAVWGGNYGAGIITGNVLVSVKNSQVWIIRGGGNAVGSDIHGNVTVQLTGSTATGVVQAGGSNSGMQGGVSTVTIANSYMDARARTGESNSGWVIGAGNNNAATIAMEQTTLTITDSTVEGAVIAGSYLAATHTGDVALAISGSTIGYAGQSRAGDGSIYLAGGMIANQAGNVTAAITDTYSYGSFYAAGRGAASATGDNSKLTGNISVSISNSEFHGIFAGDYGAVQYDDQGQVTGGSRLTVNGSVALALDNVKATAVSGKGYHDLCTITGGATLAVGSQGITVSQTVADFAEISIAAGATIAAGSVIAPAITAVSAETAGTYTLATGFAAQASTITVVDANGGTLGTVTLSESVTGGTFSAGDFTYTVTQTNDALTLTIAGGGPVPPVPTATGAEVILTITDPNHDYKGATGGWKVQADQTVAWQDLTTLGEGYAYLGLGATAANKAMPDIYVYNAEAKYIAAYVTDDTGAITGFESVFTGEAALMQAGLADFNADGVSDLLLRTADGFVGYYANGQFAEVQGLGTEWTVAALGDVDGNGRADVVIAHEAGYVGAYLVGNDGSISWADLGNLDSTTRIVGAGDVNGDGTDDVIVQVGSDYFGAWLCGGGSVTGFFGIGTFAGEVQDIADYNADGKDDLLFRTASGVVGAALITAADTTTWAEYGALGAEWSTKGVGIL